MASLLLDSAKMVLVKVSFQKMTYRLARSDRENVCCQIDFQGRPCWVSRFCWKPTLVQMETLKTAVFKCQAKVPSIWTKDEVAPPLSRLAAAKKAFLSSTNSDERVARQLIAVVSGVCRRGSFFSNSHLFAMNSLASRGSLPAGRNGGLLHWSGKAIGRDLIQSAAQIACES